MQNYIKVIRKNVKKSTNTANEQSNTRKLFQFRISMSDTPMTVSVYH